MRIIILGAGGQLGRIVFETLCTEFPSAEIIGTVRQHHYHFEGVKGRTHQRSLVFDPLRDDWRALGCADVLINCIGSITCKSATDFFQVHAGISLKICIHRAELGFPRIIQVSALGADKQSPSVFLRSKAFADQLLLQQKKHLGDSSGNCVYTTNHACAKTNVVEKEDALFPSSEFCSAHDVEHAHSTCAGRRFRCLDLTCSKRSTRRTNY